MALNSAAKTAKSGLSLYANLLEQSDSGSTISGAPVSYKQNATGTDTRTASTDKQQISAASLRFQPTKRPQAQVQKAKPKASLPKSTPVNGNDGDTGIPKTEVSAPIPAPSSTTAPKSTLADWTGVADDDFGYYGGEKRQRGGRKKRKKNHKEDAPIAQNWDDIYDPSRPNNYDDYKNSDEKLDEIREWKDRLYAHRMARSRSSDDSDSDGGRRPPMNNQFAPPPSFAPPPAFDDKGSPPPPPPPPPSDPVPAYVPDDPTGEDAFERRKRLSQMSVPLPPPPMTEPPPPPPPAEFGGADRINARPTQSHPAASTIIKAPVRYSLPQAPPEIPATEAELESAFEAEKAASLSAQDPEFQPDQSAVNEDAPRSLRPGQKGFAERLMSKYGWSKGSGLGANESGMLNPLRVQVEKQKKRPDSEGGGFVGPSGMGKIIASKKKGGGGSGSGDASTGEGRFGKMSEVVILKGMVDGMDLDAELGAGDGGLMQEIGEECAEKYGRVERVFIDREPSRQGSSMPVFVKFTSQLSALRAVNALQGRIFNGNTISARFFDTDRLDQGVYE